MVRRVYGSGILIIPSTYSPEEESKYIAPRVHEDDAIPIILQGIVAYKGRAENTEVGDLVVFDEFEHRKLTLNGVSYIYVKSEEELICKLEINE